MAGRKSLKDELKLFERYSDLTEPYFRVLKKRLESGKPDQENWAVEQLTKAYTKMIPQTLAGDPDNPLHVVTGFNYLAPNDSNNQTDPKTASRMVKVVGPDN